MDFQVLENDDTVKATDDKMEPDELWEECWFFGNLLDMKSKICRSFSDPCTSSSSSAGVFSGNSYEEVYESIRKKPADGESPMFNLVKAPSLPASMADRSVQVSEGCCRRSSRSDGKGFSTVRKLTRGPSLPTAKSLEKEELQDEEVEFSMGKLIRQASIMKYEDILPPRTHVVKNLTESPSKLWRHQSRKKPEEESIKPEGLDESKTRPFTTQKRSSLLESKNSLNPPTITSIPSLLETKRTDQNRVKSMSRPSHSDLRRSRSSVLPVPKWGGKKSDDAMKEQIRFWARAVASNVH